MSTRSYYDMDADDLESEIIGKKVVKVDTQDCTITLEDGTLLAFEDASGCCAWFSAELTEGNLTENMVTSVRQVNWYSGAEDSWALHILAEDHRICDVMIEGDPTSGYYCQSITLNVTTPGD